MILITSFAFWESKIQLAHLEFELGPETRELLVSRSPRAQVEVAELSA
jgi:hypothetical protein